MHRHTVLIVADEAEFGRDLVSRWQMERTLPSFTITAGDVWTQTLPAGVELALVGPSDLPRLRQVIKWLQGGSAPVICVLPPEAGAAALRAEFPRLGLIRQHEDWLDTLVLLGTEVLRRAEVQARLRRLEQESAALERHAALGKYMLQLRHGFNNALTSVLGNAELLLEQPAVPAGARDQVNTIHSMALRLHEMMQRFSSLEAEMVFAEKASQNETKTVLHANVSGD